MVYQWNRNPFRTVFPEIFAINRSNVQKAFRSRFRGVTQENFLVIWVQKGWQDYQIGPVWRRVHGGEMLVVPAGTRLGYQGRPTTRILAYELFVALHQKRPFFGLKHLDPLRDRLKAVPFTHTIAPKEMGVWMKLLFDEPGRKDPLQASRVLTYTLNCLRLAVAVTGPGYVQKQKIPGQVLAALDYMNANMEKPITLRDLSNHTGFARSTLIQAFQHYTGVAPIQQLMEMRVQRASELLAETGLPVTAIAMQTGFASSQHFATVFKRFMLVTPSTYRKEAGALKGHPQGDT